MNHKQLIQAGCLGLSLAACQAPAAVSPEQAARLGADLTPVGAEAAGNADGSIPAWTGGLPKDAGSKDANGFLADPFAGEKPLFIITAENVGQYQGKLTPGQLAMFKRYPDSYRIPVYPSHRSVSLPDRSNAATRQNAVQTRLAEGGNGLEQFQPGGVPFPLPHNGLEAIWNHITRFRGYSVKRITVQASPQVNGSYTPSVIKQNLAFPIGLTDYSADKMTNILYMFREEFLGPARKAGNVTLVHETLNQVREPRMAWEYNAGQRRVRRAPQIAYDSPGADGMRTIDDSDMYNGAPDRFEWKLIGKQELYIPYNSYRLESPRLKYDDIIRPGHINPDHTRYELHRVWHVVATLKPGERHLYSKRDFYIDEDSWQVAEADAYDSRGNLWRVAEGHTNFFYDQQIPWFAGVTHYDVISGRYAVGALHNEEKDGYRFDFPVTSKEFTPSALRASGIR
ncbi:DUF1329 domain-containing protein [Metapseudomonas lalkuanensis]|uniref:DUF1329 domain-containing protein n=1 Tax=Metapseudomonas lalkuanensis TaxID=2604832 RepID=A0A5J6QSQ9_9GAMM|nr:DUF1329 domain-containing protein [Pseudomonas lalkuanensis]QEY64635.1 DUF1329 domain-containing protein [Pseudomonas lalkuanensis]